MDDNNNRMRTRIGDKLRTKEPYCIREPNLGPMEPYSIREPA